MVKTIVVGLPGNLHPDTQIWIRGLGMTGKVTGMSCPENWDVLPQLGCLALERSIEVLNFAQSAEERSHPSPETGAHIERNKRTSSEN